MEHFHKLLQFAIEQSSPTVRIDLNVGGYCNIKRQPFFVAVVFRCDNAEGNGLKAECQGYWQSDGLHESDCQAAQAWIQQQLAQITGVTP